MNGYILMKIVGKDMISNQAKEKGKGKIPPDGGIKKKSKCSFSNMNGHIKKDCSEFQKWFENKDFTDFETCVICIKAEQANKYKKCAKRSSKLLEIIHSDICCPDMGISD
ncbi:hypothetical protein MTR_1g115280 [Medicago truncatula]|uniref:Uncharacterized protein n=1 Tax=Medicago truncatula TaxID=3880 RepID=A0A072VSS0_MEDTR|nr:hypothetical protein MTR_1g115280 [Medicago truncatula]